MHTFSIQISQNCGHYTFPNQNKQKCVHCYKPKLCPPLETLHILNTNKQKCVHYMKH